MEKKYSLDWMDEGNCINDSDAAERLTSDNYGVRNEAKRRFCKGCPVVNECLGYAIHMEDYGMHVMGGLDGKERKALSASNKELAKIAFKQYKILTIK